MAKYPQLLAFIRPKDSVVDIESWSIQLPRVNDIVQQLLIDAYSYVDLRAEEKDGDKRLLHEFGKLITWKDRSPVPVYSHPQVDAMLTATAIASSLQLPSWVENLGSLDRQRRIEHSLYDSRVATDSSLTSFIFHGDNSDATLDQSIRKILATTHRVALTVIDYHSGAFNSKLFPALLGNEGLDYIKSHGIYGHTPESQTNLQNGWYVLFWVRN